MSALEVSPLAATHTLLPGLEASLLSLVTWAREALRQSAPQLSGLEMLLLPGTDPDPPHSSFQGAQVLASTYNQAAQLWNVGEAQSKVRP
jgi:hypothetical protein